MTPVRVPSLGEEWSASISSLAKAYGKDEDAMAMTVYTVAEQIHRHYCLARGIVNHQEARPDQHVAVSVLMALAGTDWWVVKGDEVVSKWSETVDISKWSETVDEPDTT